MGRIGRRDANILNRVSGLLAVLPKGLAIPSSRGVSRYKIGEFHTRHSLFFEADFDELELDTHIMIWRRVHI